jgi:geranylgeranylglycerol-phosphate geranylgeranyltransferase
LVRVPNSLIIGLAVVVGEAIALGRVPAFDRALFGFLTATLMMAGTMVMNDVYDVEVDRVNSPDRPIPSGRVSSREALGFAGILSALSIVFSIILGLWTLLTAFLALVLMLYYNTRGKRTGLPGNAVVSFNVALPFFYGGVAVGSLRPLLFVFSVLAFLSNLGREVAKGIPDVQGDRELGIRTLAVMSGPRLAGVTSAALFSAAVLLSFLPPLLGRVSLVYFPTIILADLGFIYSAYSLLVKVTPESVRRVKTWVLLWMLLGLIGFLLGGIIVS